MRDVLTYREHGRDLGDVIVTGLGSLFAEIGLESLFELVACLLDAL